MTSMAATLPTTKMKKNLHNLHLPLKKTRLVAGFFMSTKNPQMLSPNDALATSNDRHK